MERLSTEGSGDICKGDFCRDVCDYCEEEEMKKISNKSYENNKYFRYAVWHWMKFQHNMMKYLYLKQRMPSQSGHNFRRQSQRNWLLQNRTRANLKEGCEACREEAIDCRSGSRRWSDHEDLHFQNLSEQCEISADEDSDDNEYFQMDLDEEFKKFLEISEKHRQEREKVKRQQSNGYKRRNDEVTRTGEFEADIEYIDICKKPLITTTNAPQHVDKIKDYKELYGDRAEKILCLEASMQLQFDKFCDTSRPVYWPCIPLKF